MLLEARLTTRLILLCSGPTRSSRTGGFPASDEPLDDGGLRMARRRGALAPRPGRVLVSPAQVAIDTAQALGLEGIADPVLADIDHGSWSGRSFTEVQSSHPELIENWIMNPASGTPDGETLAAVVARMMPWLADAARSDGTILAITHPMIIRACLANAIAIPLQATFHIDIAPLSTLTLSFNRQWRLQELARP